jgi:hypothetical protein
VLIFARDKLTSSVGRNSWTLPLSSDHHLLVEHLARGMLAFEPAKQSETEQYDERPILVVLPFAFDLPITRFATLKTADETFSPESESHLL